jgi:hypothetical protein
MPNPAFQRTGCPFSALELGAFHRLPAAELCVSSLIPTLSRLCRELMTSGSDDRGRAAKTFDDKA